MSIFTAKMIPPTAPLNPPNDSGSSINHDQVAKMFYQTELLKSENNKSKADNEKLKVELDGSRTRENKLCVELDIQFNLLSDRLIKYEEDTNHRIAAKDQEIELLKQRIKQLEEYKLEVLDSS